jgi:predicted anti-sigma-YlaC factor YlaD
MRPRCLLLVAAIALVACGCSIKRLAVNKVGDAIASSGSGYESDEDPELVGDALPFSLKLLESLLAESPEHEGMLLAACKGFTSYAYAYVDREAEIVLEDDLDRGLALEERARKLYLRALGYGLRGLELRHPGLTAGLLTDPAGAAARVEARSVPLLYWSAAALGLAISVSVGDAAMVARLPEVEALLDRALALDEDWQDGALHEFAIVLESARPMGGAGRDALRRHFDRAIELSGGDRASVYVAWAESVSVEEQNATEFRTLLEQALAIDADRRTELRLANLLTQRRARWLLDRVPSLFLEAGDAP